jgi:predicted nucleotidyltransferase
MYIFNPDEQGALKYVHPVNKQKIRRLLDSEIPDYVDKIILFGSCLDLSCRTESDIDLFFITGRDYDDAIPELHMLCRNMRNSFDILIDNEEDFSSEAKLINSVEHEAYNKGITIYEKEKSIPV